MAAWEKIKCENLRGNCGRGKEKKVKIASKTGEKALKLPAMGG